VVIDADEFHIRLAQRKWLMAPPPDYAYYLTAGLFARPLVARLETLVAGSVIAPSQQADVIQAPLQAFLPYLAMT
jgi:hypothetical protein